MNLPRLPRPRLVRRVRDRHPLRAVGVAMTTPTLWLALAYAVMAFGLVVALVYLAGDRDTERTKRISAEVQLADAKKKEIANQRQNRAEEGETRREAECRSRLNAEVQDATAEVQKAIGDMAVYGLVLRDEAKVNEAAANYLRAREALDKVTEKRGNSVAPCKGAG